MRPRKARKRARRRPSGARRTEDGARPAWDSGHLGRPARTIGVVSAAVVRVSSASGPPPEGATNPRARRALGPRRSRSRNVIKREYARWMVPAPEEDLGEHREGDDAGA